MPRNEVIFGWGAPPMKEQHPILSDEDAEHFDRDNEAIIRLSVRGLIPSSQKFFALKKLARNVEKAVRKASLGQAA